MALTMMNSELERNRREILWPLSKYRPEIPFEFMNKTKQKSGKCSDQDTNR
jgi:hypothetical protein